MMLSFLAVAAAALFGVSAIQEYLPPSAPLGAGLTALIGLGASIGTALVARAGSVIDDRAGRIDAGVRQAIGPLLPVVTTGLAVVLPALGNAIGVADLPPADIVANAPVAAVLGVVFREAARKWVVPLLGGRR